MKLKLENIGAIRNANIDINGLTVIAGENSTGKSTIGKLIYTIVKSLNNFKVENVGFQLSSLKDVTRDFSFIVKKQEMKVLEEDYYKDLCNNCDKLLHAIDELQFYIQSEESTTKFVADKMEWLFLLLIRLIAFFLILPTNINTETHMLTNLSTSRLKKINMFWSIFSEYIDTEETLYLSNSFINVDMDLHFYIDNSSTACIQNVNNIEELLDLLQRCCSIYYDMNNNIDNQTIINDYISSQLTDEFSSGLYSNIFNKPGTVDLFTTPDFHFHINVTPKKYDINAFPENIYFEDATYIESPIMLYFNKYNIPDTPSIPKHIKDLLTKLSTKNKSETSAFATEKTIDKIIGGNFKFDDVSNQFIFEDPIQKPLSMTNIATGTKAIGLLQLLHTNGWIKKDNIIIIDEPEIHLHPKWQLEYCKVISALTSLGISFVITTHSPYIVQALKVYTDKMEISSKANFYITNEEQDGIHITETTNKLSAIYEKLTAPLRELM